MVWVDHPNCVRVIEWFEDDYHMFAVFYREGKGQNLFDTIILKKYSEKQIASIVG